MLRIGYPIVHEGRGHAVCTLLESGWVGKGVAGGWGRGYGKKGEWWWWGGRRVGWDGVSGNRTDIAYAKTLLWVPRPVKDFTCDPGNFLSPGVLSQVMESLGPWPQGPFK